MASLPKRKRGGKPRSGRGGRPAKFQVVPDLPTRWTRRSAYHDWVATLAPELHAELDADIQFFCAGWAAAGSGRMRLKDLLWTGASIRTSHVENDLEELIRYAIDRGFVNEEDLHPLDVKGELPVRCVDNRYVVIFVRGTVGASSKLIKGTFVPWPDTSRLEVWVKDKASGRTVRYLGPDVSGSKRPYLNINYAPINGVMRRLKVRLGYYGLNDGVSLTTTGRQLHRLTQCAAGHHLNAECDVDHDERYRVESGEIFGGFPTLDPRVLVTEVKTRYDHRQKHLQLRDGHPAARR